MNKINTEIKITVPEGYEIDEKNSTFECIKFKPIKEQEFTFVDLGLPSGTLWATCNVGAEEPSEYGDCLTFNEACEYELPKKWQFEELIGECKCEWNRKLKGYTIVGVNGNFIFLPAAGYRYGSSLYDAGLDGCYWSCTFYTSDPSNACSLYFNSSCVGTGINGRYHGRSVRPVFNTKVLKY